MYTVGKLTNIYVVYVYMINYTTLFQAIIAIVWLFEHA